MLSSRSILRATSRLITSPNTLKTYTTTTSNTAKMVKVGDAIPSVDLTENSPGTQVDLSKELASGKGLIIGVPAAFSPACSASHIPGYVNSSKLKDAGKVFVVSINDPFVMGAWGKTLDASGSTGIRFLGDHSGAFNKQLDLTFDSAAIFGNDRSKRYALVTEDGKVKEAHVEPDNTSVNVSAAEKVLG